MRIQDNLTHQLKSTARALGNSVFRFIRCKKLTEFGLAFTSISEVDKIIENLSNTLVKIEVEKISCANLLRLAKMPNLTMICIADANIKVSEIKRFYGVDKEIFFSKLSKDEMFKYPDLRNQDL